MAGGRPKISINFKELDKLCELQCTQEECASWFDCSIDTIEARCKEEYGMSFPEYFALRKGKGKIALRRNQFQLSAKNAAMAIFLGKNWLGQKDMHEISGGAPIQLNYNLDEKPKVAEKISENVDSKIIEKLRNDKANGESDGK